MRVEKGSNARAIADLGAYWSFECTGALRVYVVVQFYPWFNFYFPLFLGMVMYDNQFKTKKNKN